MPSEPLPAVAALAKRVKEEEDSDAVEVIRPIQKRVSDAFSQRSSILIYHPQGKFDRQAVDIEEQINAKLDAAKCKLYPKRRCVVNPATGDHFDVHKARMTTWLIKIVSVTTKLPLCVDNLALLYNRLPVRLLWMTLLSDMIFGQRQMLFGRLTI